MPTDLSAASRRPMTREPWASANRRRACLVCGTSGAVLLRLPDGRNIRACDRCIRSDMAREAWAGAEPREPLPSEVTPDDCEHFVFPWSDEDPDPEPGSWEWERLHGCMDCGVCDDCIERSRAHFEEMSDAD